MREKKASGAKRRGIQSVEIGLRVLTAVSQSPGPSTLSAIAQLSGLSASQAHRYLASLMASGMVKQESRSGKYDLDFGAIKIGLAALSRIEPFALADEAIKDFSGKCGWTCLLAVWSENGPVVVRWYPGNPPVVTSLAIGSVLPVLQSATGRVFLSFSDQSDVLERAKLEAERSEMSIPEVTILQRTVKASQISLVSGDLIPGLRAAAAPVFDLQGRLTFTVSAIANSNIPIEHDKHTHSLLIETCRSLTESLGGLWPE